MPGVDQGKGSRWGPAPGWRKHSYATAKVDSRARARREAQKVGKQGPYRAIHLSLDYPKKNNPSLAIYLSRRCASPRQRNNGEVARPSPFVSVAGSEDTVCKLTDEKLLGWARVAMVALSSLSHLSASLLPGIAGNQ
ncbi:uncharacterized protein [Triticum aestivum]|uniref:uncharacterized protein n=1 Tax=Triticum aestivum TaxID=4565 RepID=UPI001D010D17|nr:uncharacterized protein LOC123039380 [Triticum aestivum]